jgi:hypothetical protein
LYVFSDVCRARAGQASTFEHEQLVMHVEHTVCSHIESRRAYVVMREVVLNQKQEEIRLKLEKEAGAGVARHWAGWEGWWSTMSM